MCRDSSFELGVPHRSEVRLEQEAVREFLPRLLRNAVFTCLFSLLGSGPLSAAPLGNPAPRPVAAPAFRALGQVPDFTRHVVPALTKLGCSSGACHGSFQGRGGLRLSLLGFDPVADYRALVRDGGGRRVCRTAPERSLLLLKPLTAIPHGGGKRLDPNSPAYAVLRDWLAAGTPSPGAEPAQIAGLRVSPKELLAPPGKRSQITVTARLADGTETDVTAWALYDSQNEQLAEVSPGGQVTVRSPGRTAVVVRFRGQGLAVPVTVPYARSAHFPVLPANNWVDDLVVAEWKKLGLLPVNNCSDAEYLRRVYLDIIGTLPRPEEVRAFLGSGDPEKRARLVDTLLERPEYVEFWALKWSDLLRAHRRSLGDKGLESFNSWIRAALRENRGVDRIARELLEAQGNLFTSGPVAFYYVDQTPQDLAETAGQLFMGVRLQCARCHHHPFEPWGQDDYDGMAAFFSRVERKDTKEGGRFGGGQSIRITPVAVGSQSSAQPRALGSPARTGPGTDPRAGLADAIMRGDQPALARSWANRLWAHFFGRGLVESVDDFRATNPATHPALMSRLTTEFARGGYDQKQLIRLLCGSRTYQLASRLDPQQDQDGTLLTFHRPRRMMAEALLDALNQACGTSEGFADLPFGTRAISLPDPAVASYFLDIFGRPLRTSPCECERGARLDFTQVLSLLNGEALQRKLSAPEGRVARLLSAKIADAEAIEELYLASLSRPPTPKETATAARLLSAAPNRKDGLEDLLWTLLNSAEFILDH